MSWKTTALSEIAYTAGRIGWKGLTAKEYTKSGPYFLSVHSLNYGDYVDFRDAFHISDERYEESPEIMVKPKDILICKDGAGIGKVGIVDDIPGPTTINSSLLLIRPLNDVVPKFLYYKLCSPGFQGIVQERIEGATTPHLYQREIKQFPVTLPSVSEQKRIVAILDQVFADIEQARAKTEQNLNNARELFDSVCSTSIFSVDSRSDCTVEDVVRDKKGAMRTGPFGSQLLKREIVEEGIAVLGIDNVVNNRFEWGAKRFITSEKFEELSRFEVKPGDVLITIMGTCGRCAIVPEGVPQAINTKHICCITLDQSKCVPEYLHSYFLYHPLARDYLGKKAKGAIMAGLNMGIIKALPLVLPPINAQRELVSKVSLFKEKIAALEASYYEKLVALDEFKKSILQKAFTGQLTARDAA